MIIAKMVTYQSTNDGVLSQILSSNPSRKIADFTQRAGCASSALAIS